MFIKQQRKHQPQTYHGLIDTSVPAIGVFLPTLEQDPIHGGEVTTLASDGASDGLEGFAYKTTNADLKYITLHSADSAYIPAQGYSLLVLMSSSLDGTGHGIGPRILGGSLALRATPYIASGLIAFDFGGATEGTTRCSASGMYTVGGKAFAFVCTTGERGMELWVDGEKKNSNTSNPTRTQGSYAFVAGDVYGGSSGTSEYYLIIPFNGQLTTDECAKFSDNPWQIFADRQIYIPVSAVGGAGTQNLAPSLYSDTDTFFSPTASTEYALTPALFSDPDTFYSPVVGASNNLSPALFNDADTFYSPVIGLEGGTQALLPSLFVDSDTFYSPTVTGDQVLLPTLFADSDIFYSPTVTAPGAMTLTQADIDAIVAAVLSAAQTTPIHADTRKMNGATVAGDGSSGNLWRGA